MKRTIVGLASLAGALAGVDQAAGQPFPTRPLRLVVGTTPGGAPDVLARILGPRLHDRLGQPVVIENRPGATGNLAASMTSRATPDGYSLSMVSASVAAAPALFKDLAFDPARDFSAVARIAIVPLILVVPSSLPVRDLNELTALAKQRDGRLNYASAGSGGPQHLVGELFQKITGVRMTHVPYKGGAPAVTALLGDEAQLFFAGMPPALPHVRSGRLRALAVTTAKRSPAAPEVPTMEEAGLKGFDVDNWHGIVAPARSPAAVVEQLNKELGTILRSREVRDAMLLTGAESTHGSPQDFQRFMAAEVRRWSTLAAEVRAKVD